MGSFPSTLEEPTRPVTNGGESSRSVGGVQPLGANPRARTLVIKKLTRGKLLVLGLDGSGKSTFAQQLVRLTTGDGYSNTGSSVAATTNNNDMDPTCATAIYPDPTTRPITWIYRLDGDRYLQLVDLPGRRDMRSKWYTSLAGDGTGNNNGSITPGSSSGVSLPHHSNSHPAPFLGVIFVVDLSDRVRFPLVATELARFQRLRDRNTALSKLHFFLLLNKTDRCLPRQNQSISSTSTQQQREVLREIRAELRQCVDYELRAMQRRHPDDAPNVNASKQPPPRAVTPLQYASALPSQRESMSSSGRGQAPVCTVMNAVTELCAQDIESVNAAHVWIRDELKKAPY